MKKLYYLIILTVILGLVLTGCFLSNVGQVPTSEQSGIAYLTRDPSPAGIVGLWHFDEGSGATAYDSSGNPNDGTLMGGTGWTSGKFGQALSFDGVSNYVDCGSDSSLVGISNSITISMWIYREINNSTWERLLSKGGTAAYYMQIRPDGSISGGVGGDNSLDLGAAGVSIPLNQWTHVALTYNGSIIKTYVNGVLERFRLSTATISTAITPLFIGRYLSYYKFNGAIDEVHIWDRALTADEIMYNFLLRYVEIDIKPGSDPNSINLGSKGVVPVAILSSADFDAATVNPLTVTLSGAGVKLKGNNGSLEDVNGDGSPDLVVQVCTDQFTLTPGATVAVLNAYTYADLPLTGSDLIQIVPPK